jgi:hypothetical protein
MIKTYILNAKIASILFYKEIFQSAPDAQNVGGVNANVLEIYSTTVSPDHK